MAPRSPQGVCLEGLWPCVTLRGWAGWLWSWRGHVTGPPFPGTTGVPQPRPLPVTPAAFVTHQEGLGSWRSAAGKHNYCFIKD